MARVLIIEDEPTIAMILRELLTDEGYEAVCAPDGRSGVQRLREGPKPDIVLVDLFMPGVSGRSVIEMMRADPRLEQIPVIIVTGAVPSAADFPPEGSYQDVISKPFDLSELLEKVCSLLPARPRGPDRESHCG